MLRVRALFVFQLACVMFLMLAESAASAQSTAPATLAFDNGPADSNGPVKGKPYEASKTMHTRRVLADGTVATHDFEIREARDSSGRVSVETQVETPAGSGRPPIVLVMVLDPDARTTLTWSNTNRIGMLTHLPLPGIPGGAISLSKDGKVLPVAPAARPEIIGHRVIHGMMTTGRSTKRVIEAGQIGNSEPTAVTREWWADDDLHVTVQETSSDPQHGERTTELIEIKRGEPDPARFHMPAGYTVKEAGRPASVAGILRAPAPPPPPLDLEHAPALSHEEAMLKLASNDMKERNLGAAVLVKEAQSSDDPGKKDDIAYRLARADVGLPEARQLAEAAVLNAEAASAAAGSREKATRDDFTRDITLSRYWDTLGYVHSQLGETALAKQYIQRAWELDSLAYYGSHLARLYEQTGDTQEAVRIYREALNSPGSEDLKNTMRERLQALIGTPEAKVADSGEIVLVDATNAQEGSAFFDLFYAGGKAGPTVLFVSGTDTLKPLAPIVAKTGADTFALPDNGPEVVVRRVEVVCKSATGAGPSCRVRSLDAHQARTLLSQR
jgi:uncharacterized cupredoxin-like copper-binding protein